MYPKLKTSIVIFRMFLVLALVAAATCGLYVGATSNGHLAPLYWMASAIPIAIISVLIGRWARRARTNAENWLLTKRARVLNGPYRPGIHDIPSNGGELTH